jgi:uncharacterized membrane-anchored protein YitT (DUF2179 family)
VSSMHSKSLFKPAVSWPHSSVKAVTDVIKNLALMVCGSVICAQALNGVMIPMGFISGGYGGLAMLIQTQMPQLSLGVVYLLLNIPVFALGWMFVGRRFFLYSIAGMVIYTLALMVVDQPVPVNDTMLASLLSGILMGIGGGMILRSRGSAGGLDILGVILMKKYSIRLGSTYLGFNCLLLTAAALQYSVDAALYTLISIYVSSKITNIVVTGLSQRKAVTIISEKWQEISDHLVSQMGKSVTSMTGHGVYSNQPRQILYTVVSMQDLSRVKARVAGIDPEAFVVISDTQEVINPRIGNQPHW